MPSVRLPFIAGGALNMANATVQTGQAEPITGLELPSGLTPGAYADFTEQEANSASNTAIDTLHEGRYQWVQMDSAATNSGNGALARGQQLFWKDPPSLLASGIDPYPQQYIVTNRTQDGGQFARLAGVYINDAVVSPVTPGNWFWMFAVSGAGGRVKVKFRTSITGTPSAGAPVITANAGAGADLALADTPSSATAIDPRLYIGTVEGPANAAPLGLALVDVGRPGAPAV